MQQATRLAVGVLPALGHGSEGKRERIVREVADPVSGKRRDVVGIVRPGGVDHMHARGTITDRQKECADRFVELYERAHSDGMKGIDYSKVKVDGMGGGDVFAAADWVTRAIKELARIDNALGKPAYGLLVMVVVEGKSLREIARQQIAAAGGKGDEVWKSKALGRKLVAALDGLDHFWNVAVGAGHGIRGDGERGEVLVETHPVEVEAATIDGLRFVQEVAKLREARAVREAVARPACVSEPANENVRTTAFDGHYLS